MKRIVPVILFGALILSACAAGVSSPPPVSGSTTEAPTRLPAAAGTHPTVIVTLSTPHIEQPPNGEITAAPPNPQDCAYQWATQDLPELSSSFQQSMQTLQPQAQASAYAFGENCILADGSVGAFLPKETDFNVTLQVADLTNESDLGVWVVKVMQVIDGIPQEQLLGPQPGRVSLTFQSGSDPQIINFYTNQYHDLAAGLSPAEIYQALHSPQ